MKGLADGLWRAEVEEGVEEEEEEEDGRGGGRWKMEDGRWKMEDGRWKMEDGRWKMEDGRWKMESTQPEQANAIIWDLENDPFPYLHNLIDR